jgi:hypothetical protein
MPRKQQPCVDCKYEYRRWCTHPKLTSADVVHGEVYSLCRDVRLIDCEYWTPDLWARIKMMFGRSV